MGYMRGSSKKVKDSYFCDRCHRLFSKEVLNHISGTNMDFCEYCYTLLFFPEELKIRMKSFLKANFPPGVRGSPEVIEAMEDTAGISNLDDTMLLHRKEADDLLKERISTERKKKRQLEKAKENEIVEVIKRRYPDIVESQPKIEAPKGIIRSQEDPRGIGGVIREDSDIKSEHDIDFLEEGGIGT